MSLRRELASDEDSQSDSDEEEFFSDTDSSEAEDPSATENGVAEQQSYQKLADDPTVQETPLPAEETVAVVPTVEGSVSAEHPEVASTTKTEKVAEGSGTSEHTHESDDESLEEDQASSQSEYEEEDELSGEDDDSYSDGAYTPSDAVGSEVDVLAHSESLEGAEGGSSPAAADPEAGKADKSEQQEFEVPPGKFWLHDDRFSEDTSNRRATRANKKVWDPFDNVEWKHDKFGQQEDEDTYEGAISRGARGRGRGGFASNGNFEDGGYGYGSRGRGRGSRPGSSTEGGFQVEGRGRAYGHPPPRGRSGNHSSQYPRFQEGYEGNYLPEFPGRGRGGFRGRGRSHGFEEGSGREGGAFYQAYQTPHEVHGREGDRGRGRQGRGDFSRGRGRSRVDMQHSVMPSAYSNSEAHHGEHEGWDTQATTSPAVASGRDRPARQQEDQSWPSLPSQAETNGQRRPVAAQPSAWMPQTQRSPARAENHGWAANNPASLADEQDSGWGPSANTASGGWSPIAGKTNAGWSPSAGNVAPSGWSPSASDTAAGWGPKADNAAAGWASSGKPVRAAAGGGWDALGTEEGVTNISDQSGWGTSAEPQQHQGLRRSNVSTTTHRRHEPAPQVARPSVRSSNGGGWDALITPENAIAEPTDNPWPSPSGKGYQDTSGWAAPEVQQAASASENGWQEPSTSSRMPPKAQMSHSQQPTKSRQVDLGQGRVPSNGSSQAWNLNAQEWSGGTRSQSAASPPADAMQAMSLNAGAPDYVPPGGYLQPQHTQHYQYEESADRSWMGNGNVVHPQTQWASAEASLAMEAPYQSYVAYPVEQPGIDMQYMPSYMEGAPAYPQMEASGFMPGQMQQQQQYEENYQQYQNTAKQPLPIERPSEQSQGHRPVVDGSRGSRRYSAVTNNTLSPYR